MKDDGNADALVQSEDDVTNRPTLVNLREALWDALDQEMSRPMTVVETALVGRIQARFLQRVIDERRQRAALAEGGAVTPERERERDAVTTAPKMIEDAEAINRIADRHVFDEPTSTH